MPEAISPGANLVSLREFESTVKHLGDRHEAEVRRLEELIQSEIRHLRDRTDKSDEAAAIALTKAREALEKRLDELNQFRAAFKDSFALYATKDKVDAEINSLKEKITTIERHRSGQSGWVAGAIAVAALVFTFVLWYFEGGRGG